MDHSMANYIMQILFTGHSAMIVASWGFDPETLKQFENGVSFHVNGFKLEGTVKIEYNIGTDYFDVTFVADADPDAAETVTDIAFDELVTVIDNRVEYTGEDYSTRVREKYKL